jgi:hypothetical protein
VLVVEVRNVELEGPEAVVEREMVSALPVVVVLGGVLEVIIDMSALFESRECPVYPELWVIDLEMHLVPKEQLDKACIEVVRAPGTLGFDKDLNSDALWDSNIDSHQCECSDERTGLSRKGRN